MIKELDDLLKNKTFTTYTCSPLYNFKCTRLQLNKRAGLLLKFLLHTNRYRTEQASDNKRDASGKFIKNVLSQVDYQQVQVSTDDNNNLVPLYRISVGLTTVKSGYSENEIIFFPSNNTTLAADFHSYPLLLCRGDKELLLFMREWFQLYFTCSITRNPVSAQVLTNFTCWYSQILYNVTAEDEEDVYDLLTSAAPIKLEYYLEGVPDLQHISIRLKIFDLIRLEESIQGKDENVMDAIEKFILNNTSINVGALTLRTVMTSSVAFHLDGKVKFMDTASSHFIHSVLQDLAKIIEENSNAAELLKHYNPLNSSS